ncbi:MAG: TRAP transporter small permease subunit [Gammaproteobacteria bacterium]|jgi:TRAP-type mannitol/chloroaromatic compound transport system permease small subunit
MHRLLKIAQFIDAINRRIGQLMFVLVLIMILIGVYNASVRYLGGFFGANLSSNAYLELQWYLFGAIFMLGAAYTLQKDGHVRVDVLQSRLTPKAKAWIDLVGIVIFMLPFCAMVFWLSLPWVINSWHLLETSSNPGGLPRYPIKTVVPLAFLLLFLQGISQLIKAVAVVRGIRPAIYEESVEDDKEHSL